MIWHQNKKPTKKSSNNNNNNNNDNNNNNNNNNKKQHLIVCSTSPLRSHALKHTLNATVRDVASRRKAYHDASSKEKSW